MADFIILTSNPIYLVSFRLAESRSNPNLFETPVRRRDFMDDVNYLMATEATAKQMMMSKSSEDLSFI